MLSDIHSKNETGLPQKEMDVKQLTVVLDQPLSQAAGHVDTVVIQSLALPAEAATNALIRVIESQLSVKTLIVDVIKANHRIVIQSLLRMLFASYALTPSTIRTTLCGITTDVETIIYHHTTKDERWSLFGKRDDFDTIINDIGITVRGGTVIITTRRHT